MHVTFGEPLRLICYIIVVLSFSAYGFHRYWIIYLYLKNRKKVPHPQSLFENLPKVVIQLPIYNERYVVARLLAAVTQLDYPPDLLEIQVLDDSTDDTKEIIDAEVSRLKAENPALLLSTLRRTDRTGFKAGALQHGLQFTDAPYVFILDADFIPAPDILKKTIHFFTDPKVGMIQTRWGHLNRNYSLLTKVQAMFLDGHLLLEQTARSQSERFFNFNGTAGIWRRECIEDAGGWSHDTLTEDLDLSYRAQLAGWRFVFLKDLITPAELPVNMNGFKSQQHRWTKGSIQTCKKILPMIWKSRLPWKIKLEAFMHLTSNFTYLALVALCILLQPKSLPVASALTPATSGLFAMSSVGWTRFLLFDFPVFLCASASASIFYFCAVKSLYPKTWRKEIFLMPMLLALGIGLSISNAKAVLEALLNHRTAFIRTPKYGIGQSATDTKSKLAHLWTTCYKPVRSLLPLFELAFAAYFTYLCVNAFNCGQYSSLPFLVLFQFGFCYVAFCSLFQTL